MRQYVKFTHTYTEDKLDEHSNSILSTNVFTIRYKYRSYLWPPDDSPNTQVDSSYFKLKATGI